MLTLIGSVLVVVGFILVLPLVVAGAILGGVALGNFLYDLKH